MDFKVLAVIILTVIYLYEMLLNIISMRSVKNSIPANVSDVYDPETYQKWRKYKGEKSRLAVISETVSFAISLLLIVLNVYAVFAGRCWLLFCFPRFRIFC